MVITEHMTAVGGVPLGDANALRELYEARRLDEAWAAYERLLSEGPVTPEDHLTGSLTARLRSDLRRARTALERCLGEEPAGNTLGKALMTYGVILREIGEYVTAVHTLEQFLAGFHNYPELRHVARGSGYYNLALAYRCRGWNENAVGAYDIAIEEFRAEGMRESLRKALQNQAWVLCLIGDAPGSRDALAEAGGLITDDDGRWQQELGLAFAEAVSGQRSEALTRCGRITADHWAPPMDVVSHAYWIAGQVTLELGQIDAAEVLQRAAGEWALKADSDTRCLQDATDLRRSIHEARKSKQTGGAG